MGGAISSRDTCQLYRWFRFDCGFSKMTGEDSLHDLLDDAEALLNASPEKAIVLLEKIAMAEVSPKAEEDIKCKEIATLKLGKVLAKNKMANGKRIVHLLDGISLFYNLHVSHVIHFCRTWRFDKNVTEILAALFES